MPIFNDADKVGEIYKAKNGVRFFIQLEWMTGRKGDTPRQKDLWRRSIMICVKDISSNTWCSNSYSIKALSTWTATLPLYRSRKP